MYTCEASFLPGPIGPWLLLLNDTWKQLGLPYDIIALSCVYVGLNPCVRPFGGPIETAGPSYWWPYCLPVFPIGGPPSYWWLHGQGFNPACVRPFGGPIETAGPSYWWPYCFPVFPIGGPIVSYWWLHGQGFNPKHVYVAVSTSSGCVRVDSV